MQVKIEAFTDHLEVQFNFSSMYQDLLGFTVKATHPEHHVKVQVLSRCCTQDPCNWVGKQKGWGKERDKRQAIGIMIEGADIPK